MSGLGERQSRRSFLRRGVILAAGLPMDGQLLRRALAAEPAVAPVIPVRGVGAKVAIVQCKSYGPEVKIALKQAFDYLGGIRSMVKDKTVTVKLNLTGGMFVTFLGRPVGESYMTHYTTALALCALLFESSAKRVRFVESNPSRAALETSLALADWDLAALRAHGQVEFENTRNLGLGKSYAHLATPGGGYLFYSFDLNHSYEETDVLISLAKLKQHVTAGVTLSMKNLFGATPNTLYGGAAGTEDATEGRWPLHSIGTPENPRAFASLKLPGAKPFPSDDPGYRVPRIVTDICAARPIHLAIIDGISTMNGGEGPWCVEAHKVSLKKPGVIIAGLNPVSTDAVGTAVMGFADPRAKRGVAPFENCDNHLLLAEQAGLGTAELSKIEVLGVPIEKAVCRFG